MFNKTESYINKALIIWWLKQVGHLFVMGLLLFTSAYTLRWNFAWFYLALNATLTVSNAIAMGVDLMVERSKFQVSTRIWDKWLYAFIYFWGPIGILVTSGLEHRLFLQSVIAYGLQILALLILLAGGLIVTWTFYTNPFYASTMRIQYEREHKLISHGPYKVIRHPGYLGTIIVTLATPIALGSISALLISIGVMLGIILRTYIEDLILTRQFKGYYDYTKIVRYRLFPGIW